MSLSSIQNVRHLDARPFPHLRPAGPLPPGFSPESPLVSPEPPWLPPSYPCRGPELPDCSLRLWPGMCSHPAFPQGGSSALSSSRGRGRGFLWVRDPGKPETFQPWAGGSFSDVAGGIKYTESGCLKLVCYFLTVWDLGQNMLIFKFLFLIIFFQWWWW